MVLPVDRFDSSDASFIRCASPPESVVAGCPIFIYPNPTSDKVCNLRVIFGIFEKNFNPSSTVISKVSYIFLSLYFISSVSLLYLVPLHTSQGTYTSGKKCISIL